MRPPQPQRMNMETMNTHVLSNGMTRGEYIAYLNAKEPQNACEYAKIGTREWLDIPYGHDSQRQKLDIYLPAGSGLFPTIVHVHGGGWFKGDKRDFGLQNYVHLLQHGYALVSVGYRLANEAVFPDPVFDVLSAIAFLRRHANEYQIDPSRIGLQGGSAGSTLAMLAALWDGDIKAVALKCAILDFSTVDEQLRALGMRRDTRFADVALDTSMEALFLGEQVDTNGTQTHSATPAFYLDAHAPPILLQHGLDDAVTPYLQSQRFCEQVNAIVGENRAQLILYPDTGHDGGYYQKAECSAAQTEFFDTFLKQ